MENDPLYIAGYRKGLRKALEESRLEVKVLAIKNLLKKTDTTLAEIAEITEASIEFIAQIKSTL